MTTNIITDSNGPTSDGPVRTLVQVAHRIAGRQNLVFVEKTDHVSLKVFVTGVLVRVDFSAAEHDRSSDTFGIPVDGERQVPLEERQELSNALASFLAVWPETMKDISVEGVVPLVGAKCQDGHFTLLVVYRLPRPGSSSDEASQLPNADEVAQAWAGPLSITSLFPST